MFTLLFHNLLGYHHQVQSELHFALQFKKDTLGEPLSLASAKKLQLTISENMMTLLEVGTQLKALIPKTDK